MFSGFDYFEGMFSLHIKEGSKACQASPEQMPHLNWSHFKPEFSGKLKDAEAHLLRTNDWINTHQFQEGIKVQRFCLTLVGGARLWYKSLRPFNIDWKAYKIISDSNIHK